VKKDVMIMRSTLFVAAALAGLCFALPGQAAEFTRGEVRKIDTAQKKLTVKHEELKSLDMPAMTMVFVVADDAMLTKVKVGQTIEFVAERLNGRITITDIK
jgi:Cu/Ag efflux protein CusF